MSLHISKYLGRIQNIYFSTSKDQIYCRIHDQVRPKGEFERPEYIYIYNDFLMGNFKESFPTN